MSVSRKRKTNIWRWIVEKIRLGIRAKLATVRILQFFQFIENFASQHASEGWKNDWTTDWYYDHYHIRNSPFRFDLSIPGKGHTRALAQTWGIELREKVWEGGIDAREFRASRKANLINIPGRDHELASGWNRRDDLLLSLTSSLSHFLVHSVCHYVLLVFR